MNLSTRIRLIAIACSVIATAANGDEVNWIEVTDVPGESSLIVSDPVLGDVQIATSFPAQATFLFGSGSLGNVSWSDFDYINYDASTTGTNTPIFGTMTFTFLDGPIDSSVTRLYFTSNGLAHESSYTIDNDPIYLGDIGILEGIGTHTSLGGGLLRINGSGFNHNPDLFFFEASLISDVTVEMNQILGDGAGFTIGAAIVESVVLGDVNLDGVVNLLDINPFIAHLSNGTFQAEADVNQDGVVDLLDVEPFIDVLSG